MDKRELNLQPLGICYRLYHFITKTLASQVLRTVTLGRATYCASSSTALRGLSCEADKVVRIEDDGRKEDKGKNGPCVKGEETGRENIKLALPTRSLSNEAKAPKKMVSINENVEIFTEPIKKRKRSKSFQKSSSRDLEEEEEPKTLRPILKVASDLNDKSNPIC